LARVSFTDEAARLLVKQTNLYRLQRHVDHLISALTVGVPYVLTEQTVKQLHGIAMRGLLTNAGEYRDDPVGLTNSDHVPPPAEHVRPLMGDMYDYVTENWTTKDLVHIGAYAMWRINWIHPFDNGNGRTARAVSYLLMCAKYGALLPAKNTVLQQIIANKTPYYLALRHCDKEFDRTQDMGCLYALEEFIARLLKAQLYESLP
jgi:Fic family protein